MHDIAHFLRPAHLAQLRAIIDDRGKPIKTAGPSTPVEVLGLGGLPSPGDAFQSLTDAAKARQIAHYRETQAKDKAHAGRGARLTLESLQAQISEGGMKELPIIIKSDVQGSAEVLADTLTKLSDDRVKIRIIHSGVGAINESDVLLGAASIGAASVLIAQPPPPPPPIWRRISQMKKPISRIVGRKPSRRLPISERPLSGDSALITTPAWVRSVVSWP